MPVSAGSLYDYYNPLAGTQRNLDRFVDLYERKKQRGLQEKGLGLEERRVNLGERQENRMAGSQGIEDQYKQMLISRETEELKMKQDLMNDPATRVSVMSKALKEAYTTGGKKMADSVLKSFQNNPKYQDDTKGYTIDDFQFTKAGGMYAPIITTEGERLEGQYGFIDPQGKMHELDMRQKGTADKSESEFRQWSSQLNSLYNKRSSIRMGINPLTGIALPRTEVDAALAENEKVIKRLENRMKTQYPDKWKTFGEEEAQAQTPAPEQPTSKKLDKESAQKYIDQAAKELGVNADIEQIRARARELASE